MMQRTPKFPLLGDDEPVLVPIPQMNLYDESDLISNIKGFYHEKDDRFGTEETPSFSGKDTDTRFYQDEVFPPLFHAEPSQFSRRNRTRHSLAESKRVEKTQGQLAREAARKDLKKKRSAPYLKEEVPFSPLMKKEKPAVDDPKEKKSTLGDLANRLRQEEYILADLPATYPLDRDKCQKDPVRKKNSYDFLKKSQVYNYPERIYQKERQVAQELNLTHMEEE